MAPFDKQVDHRSGSSAQQLTERQSREETEMRKEIVGVIGQASDGH